MTAYSLEELIKDALNECAFSVVYKPFDIDKMLDLIKRAKNACDCEKTSEMEAE